MFNSSALSITHNEGDPGSRIHQEAYQNARTVFGDGKKEVGPVEVVA